MKIYIKNNYLLIDDGGFQYEGLSKDVLIKRLDDTSDNFSFNNVNNLPSSNQYNISVIQNESGVVYALQDFIDWYTENTGKSSATGNVALRWVSSNESGEPDMVIPQDTETLLPINNAPFESYNATNKITFDLVNNWVDVSNIGNKSWVTVRLTFLGVLGDADVTPSVRLYADSEDLLTYFSAHGQTSKLKNGKTTSYLIDFWVEGQEVLQFFIETDKNETIGFISPTIKIEDIS